MTTADLLVEELQARGVQFVSVLNGHGLDPFLLACRKAEMRVIDVRNEQAAGYMAEVTGRLTRTVGVCGVSGAVAHANALTGVLNAWFDGAPMLLITGITPHGDLDHGEFQDFNPVPMAAPICKYARVLDVPQRVGEIVHEAFTAATTGRPGPVHLSLPIDVGGAEVDADTALRAPVRSGAVRSAGAGDPALIEQAIDLLAAAKRPLLVAGSGVYYAHGEQALASFASSQQIPVVQPIWSRGAVPQTCPQFMGIIGAATGGPRLLGDADLVLALGCEFDYRVGQFSPPNLTEGATVVRVDGDERQLRRGLEAPVSIQGSPRSVLEQWAQVAAHRGLSPSSAWCREADERRSAHLARCHETADAFGDRMTGRDVVAAVHEVLDEQTAVLVDGGNIGQWFHQMLPRKYPGNWVTCGASGVVGWGLPGALAARAIDPDRGVVLLSGDGSFTFTVAELECAARQNLPFVAVVADDEKWGISVTGHLRNHGHALYSELGPMRLDLVAKGFGCNGVRVENKDELGSALSKAMAGDRPTVIQTIIAPSSPDPEAPREL